MTQSPAVDPQAPSARRVSEIADFLAVAGWPGARRQPLAADASFRRYDRVHRADGRRAVLMDAPPGREDVRPFLAVAGDLHRLGLSAPEVLAADAAAGLLLLEDFGDDTYGRLIAGGADERWLYALAIDLLVALHDRAGGTPSPALPPYDSTLLLQEVRLLTDWYMPAVGCPPGPAACGDFEALWHGLVAGQPVPPATLVLRDYHVDNIMLLPDRDGVRRCGLLDFQDAVTGSIAYDVVSLLEDARRDLLPGLAAAMTARYLDHRPHIDRDAFATACAVLGAQRNLKIIGVFTRLDRRDGKSRYRAHIKRLWQRIDDNLHHPVLAPLAVWLDRHLPRDRRIVPPAAPGLGVSSGPAASIGQKVGGARPSEG